MLCNFYFQKKYLNGIWVKCCKEDCGKFRFLKYVTDPKEVADVWVCEMNSISDPDHGSCDAPEDPEASSMSTVSSEWLVGSIKWAHLENYPAWPAMIDDSPDSHTSVWITTSGEEKLHVVFFNALMGSFTRAWLQKTQLLPFLGTENMSKFKNLEKDTYEDLKIALKDAKDANKLNLEKRRRLHCFLQGK